MPRQKNPHPGNPNDPDGMFVRVEQYLGSLRVRNFSERTVYHRGRQLDLFIAWCETRSLTRPEQITKPVIEAYQRHLYHWRKGDDAPLSYGSQLQRLISVRMFFKWLTRNNLLLWNPASEIDLPTLPRRLPMHVLTIEEAERVIEQPDLSDPIGVRDRAMLETLYSTGIRRMELIGLRLYDLDREHGTLRVRLGKGQKDRVVPIGERAVTWIDTYLASARPQLVFPPDPGAMFVTVEGDEINRDWLTRRVREYVASAGIEKRGSCHLFRHTCATLMLEGGADIRYIQELLGHAQVSTTQIYTQVSIRKLKAVHTLTHPGAKVDRGERGEVGIPPLAAPSGDAADSLRAVLDQERDDAEEQPDDA
jgi:integrase/recombinase XerD